MYHFHLHDIVSGTQADVLGHFPSEENKPVITEIAYDSRKIIHADKTLFIALVTPTGNGHRYVKHAYEKGVRLFLVSETPDLGQFPEALFLKTPNTLQALQDFARAHRARFSGKIVALTGSYGKTTIKEWLHFLLAPQIRLTASPGSYNSALGIPLSILLLSPDDELGIIETGISQPGEMQVAESWIKPDIGILSNIGTAHLENFKNQKELTKEKLLLFKHTDYFIYHADNTTLNEAIQEEFPATQSIGWRYEMGSAWHISIRDKKQDRCTLSIQNEADTYNIPLPFSDEISVENACHCAVLCIKEGWLTPALTARFAQLKQVEMRMQMVAGINACTILNDSYTSDISSLRLALEALALLPGLKRHSVILSDMRLRGKQASEVYTECAQLLGSYQLHKTILIGKEISQFRELFSGSVFYYESTQEFIDLFPSSLFQQEAILVKGVREYKTERIVEMLEQKRHETVLEVNLDALANNVSVYRKQIGPDTKIMAMVKAFSYGTGSIEIANQLKFRNIDYLAVAYADEGAELRRAGIDLPIMVMNTGQPSVNMLLEHRLEPEVFSFRSLHFLLDELTSRSESYLLPIHLKIDTGMHRLGFSPDEIDTAVNIILSSGRMKIASAFSHLASAEDENDDAFTAQQIALFKNTCEIIAQKCPYPFLKHIANSAGALRHADARFDMIRLGIGMYGIGAQPELQNVLRLKTNITQIRQVPAGESVGYNRAGKVIRDSRIATIPVGYADGFRRSLSLGVGEVSIGGSLFPVIGKVCMDMTMIDITGDETIQEGDEVILFGSENPVENMAKKCATIPYEILTGISPRVKRVYVKE